MGDTNDPNTGERYPYGLSEEQIQKGREAVNRAMHHYPGIGAPVRLGDDSDPDFAYQDCILPAVERIKIDAEEENDRAVVVAGYSVHRVGACYKGDALRIALGKWETPGANVQYALLSSRINRITFSYVCENPTHHRPLHDEPGECSECGKELCANGRTEVLSMAELCAVDLQGVWLKYRHAPELVGSAERYLCDLCLDLPNLDPLWSIRCREMIDAWKAQSGAVWVDGAPGVVRIHPKAKSKDRATDMEANTVAPDWSKDLYSAERIGRNIMDAKGVKNTIVRTAKQFIKQNSTIFRLEEGSKWKRYKIDRARINAALIAAGNRVLSREEIDGM